MMSYKVARKLPLKISAIFWFVTKSTGRLLFRFKASRLASASNNTLHTSTLPWYAARCLLCDTYEEHGHVFRTLDNNTRRQYYYLLPVLAYKGVAFFESGADMAAPKLINKRRISEEDFLAASCLPTSHKTSIINSIASK